LRQIAITRASVTNCAVIAGLIDQPTTRRENRRRFGKFIQGRSFLTCAGLDWQPIGVDLGAGQTRDAVWRTELNPMGEIPVLEADGERRTQSGAILMWYPAECPVRPYGQ
jgi:hypothetical protein